MTEKKAPPIICAIEDDPDIRLILERMLEVGGYRMISAKDPIEGEELLAKEKPDLILLDVMMPRMNGYDFCAKLQQNPAYVTIPVIFMTALEGSQDKAKAFSVGAVDYLTKPIDRKILMGALDRHLAGRERWIKLAQELEEAPKTAGTQGETALGRFKEFLIKEAALDAGSASLSEMGLEGIYAASERLGMSHEQIAQMVAKFSKLEYVAHIHPETIQLGTLPTPFCVNHQVVAISDEGGRTSFVIANPFHHEMLEMLKQNFSQKKSLILRVTEPEKITALLKRRSRDEVSKIIQTGVESIPISDIGTHILEAAVFERASDVHIEPKIDHTLVRFRVDGDMREIYKLKPETGLQVVSRFKAIADLDVAERRRPQDGAMDMTIDKRAFVVRLATTSTPNGESLVLRLLEPWAKAETLEGLGMTQTQVGHMMGFSQRNQGLLLIAGPTGSGKTTTIYSLLQHIDCEKRSLISIEDPVEYRILSANQQQVDEKAGMTFEALLKSAVRQDPDILFLGEMRDQYSSKMAVDFASTGHLTISTVHTANSTTAIFRLERVGITRGAMADSILGVIAQKLVKRLCVHCKKIEPINEEERKMLAPFTNDLPEKVGRPVGCDKCRQTGFLGREGIYEIVKFYPEISEMIRSNRPISKIREFAAKRGDYLISQHAIEKVRQHLFHVKDVYDAVLLEEAEYRRKSPPPVSEPSNLGKTAPVSPSASAEEEAETVIGKPRGAAAGDTEMIGNSRESAEILVVEDDEETRTLLARVLGNRGYTVTTAGDGIEALMQMGKKEFDLILSDVEMPNLDGMKLLELKEVKGVKAPVIFLTALSDAESELKGLKLGAVDYIKKPITKDLLLMRVQSVLRKIKG